MEMALAAIGGLAKGAGAGLSALSGGVGAASGVLSGVASAGSLLAGLAKSNAEASSLKQQAVQSQMQKTSEQAQGYQRTTALKKELIRALGENDVAFAAAGIDVGSGLAANAEDALQNDASREISIDRSTTEARLSMLDAQSASLRRMAKTTRRMGLLNFAVGGAKALAGAA